MAEKLCELKKKSGSSGGGAIKNVDASLGVTQSYSLAAGHIGVVMAFNYYSMNSSNKIATLTHSISGVENVDYKILYTAPSTYVTHALAGNPDRGGEYMAVILAIRNITIDTAFTPGINYNCRGGFVVDLS